MLKNVSFLLTGSDSTKNDFSILLIIFTTLLTATLLPTPDLRGLGQTHCLNAPLWSLFQEYIANILYAIFFRKLNILQLSVLVIISGISIFYTVLHFTYIGLGWDYNHFHIAILRLLYPFLAGLLIFKLNIKIIIPFPFIFCSLALVLLLSIPTKQFNGLYEALCITVFFPFLIILGASGNTGKINTIFCKQLGNLSYPLYITHYPIVQIYSSWFENKMPSIKQCIAIGAFLFCLILINAYISFKYYDLPIRNRLNKLK